MLSPGSEPHWLECSGPFSRAAVRSRAAIILSRIFENVGMRTMILKEEGDSYKGIPGLSGTTPFEPFSEVGWYPRLTNGARVRRRIDEFILLTSFKVEYGILSGSGAEVGEHLERADAMSSVVRGGAVRCGLRLDGGENCSLGGKKWSSRTLFICWGVSGSGREGKHGCARPYANLLAVNRFWGVAVNNKEDQCLFLVALIALKYSAFEVPATFCMCGVSCLQADLAALWYPPRRMVRWGDHHGLD